MVRAKTEEKGRAHGVLLEQPQQRRHAFLRAAQRVDVDLEDDNGHSDAPLFRYSISARACATSPRYASKIFSSASAIDTFGAQPSSFIVFSIFGTRFCTSW